MYRLDNNSRLPALDVFQPATPAPSDNLAGWHPDADNIRRDRARASHAPFPIARLGQMSRPAPELSANAPAFRPNRFFAPSAPSAPLARSAPVAVPGNAVVLRQYAQGSVPVGSVLRITTAKLARASPEEAKACMDALKAARVVPDIAAFNALISAYSRHGKFNDALNVTSAIHASGAVPDLKTYSALITASGRSGQVDLAINIFNVMCRNQVEPDVIAYSALIRACAKAKQAAQALQVFQHMRTTGVKPNAATYLSLIEALGEGSAAEKNQIPEILNNMVREKLVSPSLGYTADTNSINVKSRNLFISVPGESVPGSTTPAIAKAIFEHHANAGRLLHGTLFIFDVRAFDPPGKSVLLTMEKCISDRGWIPAAAMMPDGSIPSDRLFAYPPPPSLPEPSPSGYILEHLDQTCGIVSRVR